MSGDAPPRADVVIDETLVRRLLRAQHPDLADLPMSELPSGFDHVMVGLGDELVVRLPRRALGASMIGNEQRFLGEVGADLPLPVPVPERVGVPGAGYPYRWSVIPRFPGIDASRTTEVDHPRAAEDLGRFLAALHRPAPADAPTNPYRGVPLSTHVEDVEGRLARLRATPRATDALDVAALEATWAEALSAPAWDRPAVWAHGDLHPRNVLVHAGRITAIVDFSDVFGGDPAVDAAIAWLLLPVEHHHRLRGLAPSMDDATWTRGRGWALRFGLILYLTGVADGDVGFTRVGRAGLERLASTND